MPPLPWFAPGVQARVQTGVQTGVRQLLPGMQTRVQTRVLTRVFGRENQVSIISKNSENIPRGMDVFKAGKESEMDIHTARLSTAIRILNRKPTEPWTAVSVSADGTIYPKKASDKIDGLTYLTTERPVLHKYWVESGSPATIDDIKHCDMVPEVESEVVSL